MTEELKPCPFCGGDEIGVYRPSDERTGPHWHDSFIRCYRCHVETSEYPTKAEAIAAWNTRADPAAYRAAMEAMVGAADMAHAVLQTVLQGEDSCLSGVDHDSAVEAENWLAEALASARAAMGEA